MTTPVGGTGSGAHDEVLAGEYVLGVLSGENARQVEARLKNDPQFAAMVRRWQENLTDLDDIESDPWSLLDPARAAATGAPIPVHFTMPAIRPFWQSFAFWRGLGLLVFALAAIYALFDLRNSGTQVIAPARSVNVASALYDQANGQVEVTTGPVSAPQMRIWLIEPAGQAHMLGEMAPGSSIKLTPDMKAQMDAGASLAVAPAN